MFGNRRNRGGNQISLPILLLGMQIMRVGFDHIPPVTLVTLLAQVAIYLRLPFLNIRLPHIQQVCVSAEKVWYYEEWQRILYSSFFHVNDWHLYYNMVSFLWKGISLERKLGSKYFAYMIAVFSVLTSCTVVGMAMLADEVLQDPSYLYQCAAGFSGVLFALKVVTTHLLPPGVTYIMGFIPVHSRIACWAELLVIHVLVPNSSFMGHLAGILIGMAYVKGPLKYIMDYFIQQAPSYTYQQGTAGQRVGNNRRNNGGSFWGFGQTGRQTQAPPTAPPPGADYGHAPRNDYRGNDYGTNYRGNDYGASQRSYQEYTGGLTEEDQIARAVEESIINRSNHNNHASGAPYPTSSSPLHPTPTLPAGAGPPPYTEPSAPPAPPSYDEIYGDQGAPSQPTNRLYPDLSGIDQEELRRRRLQRLDSRNR